jgi:hypothetical protein
VRSARPVPLLQGVPVLGYLVPVAPYPRGCLLE